MTAPEQSVLLTMLAEIEDLRAHQAVTTTALSALPDLSTTNLANLTTQTLEKNQATYDHLRKQIEELA